MRFFPIFLARRLTLSSQGKKSSPAVKVAIIAVALSVAVMLAAISIVMGFKEEITKKVLGFNPHITLSTNQEITDDPLVSLTPSMKSLLDSQPDIKEYTLSATAPAIFKTDNDFKGIYLKTADSQGTREFLSSQLVSGKIGEKLDTADVIISEAAARQLNLKAGDKLPTYFITDNVHVRPLTVKGIYNSHFDTYDDIFAYGTNDLIQDVGNIKSHEGTTINITIKDFNKINEVAASLQQQLNEAYKTGLVYKPYRVDTALRNGANYFSWLQLLDMNVVIVLILMTTVACITLISGILIIIVDKKRFIAIMKSLGASNKVMRKTFVWLTLRVALTGLIIGNVLMLALLFIQREYHVIPLKADSYYIDFVPVSISWVAFAILNASIFIITYLILVFPARFVGSVSPASSLNME